MNEINEKNLEKTSKFFFYIHSLHSILFHSTIFWLFLEKNPNILYNIVDKMDKNGNFPINYRNGED